MKTDRIASNRTYNLVSMLLIVSFAFAYNACNSIEEASVTGDLKDPRSSLEGKTLYLENLETESLEDSCVVKNGRFKLSGKRSKDFSPYVVRVVYSLESPYRPAIAYQNPFKKNTWESTFYLDRGNVHLEKVRTTKLSDREIFAFKFTNINKQTAVAFKHFSLKTNAGNSEEVKNFNKSVISKHPNSMAMLDLLNRYRTYLPEDEMKSLLSTFDESVKTSSLYRDLKTYVDYDLEKNTDFPTDITLKKPDNTTTSTPLNKKAKYNMVVFWASWCGPCRMEIPQIKKLYAKHKDKVNIISISVDKKENLWRKALEQEKMPWDQFLVSRDDSYVKLDKKYNIQTIPVWILLDKDNKLIERKMGMSTDEEETVDQIVDIILVKNSDAGFEEKVK